MPSDQQRLSLLGHTGAVLTVGTFDGIHLGHRELLDHLCHTAEVLALPAVVLTFEPHPLEIVRPAGAPPLLTTPEEKIEALAQAGPEHMVLLRFDETLSSYEPRRFVEEILLAHFNLEHLVIGYDHAFGRGRSGNADTLRRIGSELGFGVDVVGPVTLGGEPISSSSIRRALERGDVVGAAGALGRPYAITGLVTRGDGRGRELGFPTANLRIRDPRKLLPREGIYAVQAELRDRRLNGVLHLGPRPTFDGAAPSIEFFAFDFDGDLYGQRLRIAFCERIRDIERFDSVDALVSAMQSDSEAALRLFAAGAGACGATASPLQSRA